MRHRRNTARFGRDTNGRKALIRNLVSSIVEHGRIETTLPKAKELRRHVEKAITMGKKNTIHARRILLSKYPNKKTIDSIFSDWAPKFADRPGGYTRILKIGRRPGDGAETAFIEFLDYKSVRGEAEVKATTDDTSKKKALKKTKKKAKKTEADSTTTGKEKKSTKKATATTV